MATATQQAQEDFLSFMVAHGAQRQGMSLVLYKGYHVQMKEDTHTVRYRGIYEVFVHRPTEPCPQTTPFSYASLHELRACFIGEFESTHLA